MTGYSISLARRNRCEASGKEYTRYSRSRWSQPNEHGMLSCPICGKGVTLRPKETGGNAVVIPRHLERIVGL